MKSELFFKNVEHLHIYEYAEVEKESSPKRNSINKGVEKEIMISDMLMWQCHPQ